MYGYIYITTDMLTGKKYIGKHKATEFEFNTYKGSGIDLCTIPKEEYNTRLVTTLLEAKNGVPTICESLEELNKSEIYYISLYDCVNSEEYYNRSNGGDGGDIYSLLSVEQQKLRDEQISRCSQEWWNNVSAEEISKRSENWRKTYFNKSEEELLLRRAKNSEGQKAYNRNMSPERRLELNAKLKASAKARTADAEKERIRKEKEKLTKSKQTEEQKAAYVQKQRETHQGQRYYTDGVTVIKCFPQEVPEGFYLGGAHRNNYRYIIVIDGETFLGAGLATEHLVNNGYPDMSSDRLLAIARKGDSYRGKYEELKNRIQCYAKQGV